MFHLASFMRPIRALALASTLLAFITSGVGLPASRRQVASLNGISEPIAASTISAGSAFPFTYTPYDVCHEAYSGITIWLVPGPDPPTPSSLNATKEFSSGDYLACFGQWLMPDFEGVPPLAPGPPPATFSMPELDPSFAGTTVYMAVVETSTGCPPIGGTEYALSSVGFTYSG